MKTLYALSIVLMLHAISVMKVISEIRAELGHIQREIVAARKNKENVSFAAD